MIKIKTYPQRQGQDKPQRKTASLKQEAVTTLKRYCGHSTLAVTNSKNGEKHNCVPKFVLCFFFIQHIKQCHFISRRKHLTSWCLNRQATNPLLHLQSGTWQAGRCPPCSTKLWATLCSGSSISGCICVCPLCYTTTLTMQTLPVQPGSGRAWNTSERLSERGMGSESTYVLPKTPACLQCRWAGKFVGSLSLVTQQVREYS